MSTDDPRLLLLSPYRSDEDEASGINGSKVTVADCGHRAWISPPGMKFLQDNPGLVSICMNCQPMPGDIRNHALVPGALDLALDGARKAGDAATVEKLELLGELMTDYGEPPAAVPAHPWFDCRPALLLLPGTSQDTGALGISAIDRVWRGLQDSDRHRFHQFICLNDRSEASIAVMLAIKQALKEAGVD